MKILFRFDESPEIGLGHRSRCLALAAVVHSVAHAACFIASTTPEPEFPSWINSIHLRRWDDHDELVRRIRVVSPDLIVVDRYGLTPAWYERIARSGVPILRISDTPVNPEGCSYVLDQSPAHQRTSYQRLTTTTDEIRYMIGTKWALLRSEFFNRRHLHHQRQPGPDRLLLSLGGGDVVSATTEALRELADVDRRLEIVVLSGWTPRSIKQEATFSPHDVSFIRSTGEIADLMAGHDGAIGAGGVSALERCVVGLPAVNISLADNQVPNVNALALTGAALIGTPGQLAAAVDNLLENKESIRQAALRTCDGLGAVRCTRQLGIDLTVGLRAAIDNVHDKHLTFGHQQISGIRSGSRDESAPDWAAHSVWFDDMIERSDRRLFFIEVAGFVVGQIRLDDRPGDRAEVSILVVPEAQGLGFATQAIRSVVELSSAQLFADIHPENGPSRRAFEKAGFVRVDDRTYELRRP